MCGALLLYWDEAGAARAHAARQSAGVRAGRLTRAVCPGRLGAPDARSVAMVMRPMRGVMSAAAVASTLVATAAMAAAAMAAALVAATIVATVMAPAIMVATLVVTTVMVATLVVAIVVATLVITTIMVATLVVTTIMVATLVVAIVVATLVITVVVATLVITVVVTTLVITVVVTLMVATLVVTATIMAATIMAATIMAATIVVGFTATPVNMGFDAGVNLNVAVFAIVDVTVVDGAIVVTANNCAAVVSANRGATGGATVSRATATGTAVATGGAARRAAFAAATAAGRLALLADVLDATSQVMTCRGHDGVDGLDCLEGVHKDLEDRLDASDPLGSLTSHLGCRHGRRETERADFFRDDLETRDNDIRDSAHDGVVDIVNRVRDLGQRFAESTRRLGHAVDRAVDDGLTLLVGAYGFTVHVGEVARSCIFQLFSNGCEGAGDGIPAGAHAVHLPGVAGQLVDPGFERIHVLHDPFDDRACDATDRIQHQIAGLLNESPRGINEVGDIARAQILGSIVESVKDGQALCRGGVVDTPSVFGGFGTHFLTPSNRKRRSVRSSS